MNISDYKKTAGQAHPAKLKDRIQKTAGEKTEKKEGRAESAQGEKTAVTKNKRALEYAKLLSRMVQCDTTSYPYSEEHPAAVQLERFHGYHRLLEELFPKVHQKLEKTDLDGSLLYFWKGKRSVEKRDPENVRPIVLMGHQDVVPVTDADGKYPPFSGKITG